MIIDAGRLGLSYVEGGYKEDYNFDFLDFIITDTGCYLSLDYDNLGNPLTDLDKWKCMINFVPLNSAVSNAQQTTEDLIRAGIYANEQGDYAKGEADKVAAVILKAMRVATHPTYIERLDHHVYEWDDDNQTYVDTGITIDVILNYSDMTEDEKNDFAERMGANIGLATETDIRAIVSEYPKALFDSNGELILDENDNYTLVEGEPTGRNNKLNMTIAQLNTLLTTRNNDGTINTIPEVIDAMQNMEEGDTVDEVAASNIDVDEVETIGTQGAKDIVSQAIADAEGSGSGN